MLTDVILRLRNPLLRCTTWHIYTSAKTEMCKYTTRNIPSGGKDLRYKKSWPTVSMVVTLRLQSKEIMKFCREPDKHYDGSDPI